MMKLINWIKWRWYKHKYQAHESDYEEFDYGKWLAYQAMMNSFKGMRK